MANVTLSLVSGIGENVTLSSDVYPSQAISVSFTPASGLPTYSATMNLTSGASAGMGNYTVTVIAVSSTGVAHNATLVLVVKSPPPSDSSVQTPNYLLFVTAGLVAAIGVIATYVLVRRARGKRV